MNLLLKRTYIGIVLNMGYKVLFIGLIGLIGLSSCDSREDWFELNSTAPDLIVEIDGVKDTIGRNDMKKIVVNLHPSHRINSYDGSWDSRFYADTCEIVIKGVAGEKIQPIRGAFIEFPHLPEGIGLSISYISPIDEGMDDMGGYYDKEKKELHWAISCRVDISKYQHFTSDTSAVILKNILTNSYVKARDAFENIYFYAIEINFVGDVPPTPVFSSKKIEEPHEYLLSLEDSYDRDGKIEKYEFCIDGNIVAYEVTDNRFERTRYSSSNPPAWQSGVSAYGGTYIKATSINSVNHSFQSPGEHVVYYRCMDNLGVWSMWYSQTINVE